MKLLKKNKGFTVVELVIVIGVIAVLSAILIPTFVNVTENAKKSARKAELQSGYSAFAAEAIDGVIDNVYYMSAGADTDADPSDDVYTNVAIKTLAQEEVVMKYKDDKYYSFNGKEWAAYEGETSGLQLVAGAHEKYYVGDEHTLDTAATQATLSTYNQVVVYYAA